jgi:hypothetical protein
MCCGVGRKKSRGSSHHNRDSRSRGSSNRNNISRVHNSNQDRIISQCLDQSNNLNNNSNNNPNLNNAQCKAPTPLPNTANQAAHHHLEAPLNSPRRLHVPLLNNSDLNNQTGKSKI